LPRRVRPRARLAGVGTAVLLLAGAPTSATTQRPIAVRGVIEGYYGRPWSAADRREVIAFLGAHRLNTFVYAPKNDPFHRARWREPYPAETVVELRATAAAARAVHVRFVYALSPVLDICYSCTADFRALVAKLRQVRRAGIRRVALLFDDGGQLTAPSDLARYGGNDAAALARAQADLVNRVVRWLRAHGLPSAPLVVPSDYAGTECHPYHAALARGLRRGIPLGWTGPGVFAAEITADQARARAACLPGHPVVLWDNYPVNDTVLSNNLHLGPLTGRPSDLPHALGGYLLNPMTQAHASLVALGTAAAYLTRPDTYDPEAEWRRTLSELSRSSANPAPTDPGLGVLAEQTRSSALDLDDARALAAVVDGIAADYPGGRWTPAVTALDAEEARQAMAPAAIATQLGGSRLATEIAPWVSELAAHAARGGDAVTLLRALKPSFADFSMEVSNGMLTVSGRALAPDAATATALGPGFASDAVAIAVRIATPPLLDFVNCLGDLVGADINFCPSFGLNVHGKSFYVLIRTVSDIQVITGHNVHERLVQVVAGFYGDWSGHQGPGSDTLTLTLDAQPVSIAGDGTFSATTAAIGGHVLLLTTAAGDQTAVDLP
jgi:hypothetical protein